jgi:hypothetical protein
VARCRLCEVICGCAAHSQNSNMCVVFFSVFDLCNITLVIFLYKCVTRY